MPVTKLLVEGDLDTEILAGLCGGAPAVEKRGGKYGLPGMVQRERASTANPGIYFLRDRDFDFEPAANSPHAPSPMLSGDQKLLGWRWFRHSLENYLLEPVIAAEALHRERVEWERLIERAGQAIRFYQAARWTMGQARAQLPPSRKLRTSVTDAEFGLPENLSVEASRTWCLAAASEFIAPVQSAFDPQVLKAAFESYRVKFEAFAAADILVWFSGKDILSHIANQLNVSSPKEVRNRLRDWVRNHPEKALELLPEWKALKRVMAATP
jgi:hypothetical protein